MYHKSQQSGFALLMTLIVVSVVLSIGLSILDLSIKQVRLSTNTKDSEIAFHAANAGMECALYWRRDDSTSDDMETGQIIDPDCFGGTRNTNDQTDIINPSEVSGDGDVYLYEYSFTWNGDRCSQITTLVMSADAAGGGLVITESAINGLIPGFSSSGDKNCAAGARCTTISVQGYNKPCNAITSYGVIQREVLLEL